MFISDQWFLQTCRGERRLLGWRNNHNRHIGPDRKQVVFSTVDSLPVQDSGKNTGTYVPTRLQGNQGIINELETGYPNIPLRTHIYGSNPPNWRRLLWPRNLCGLYHTNKNCSGCLVHDMSNNGTNSPILPARILIFLVGDKYEGLRQNITETRWFRAIMDDDRRWVLVSQIFSIIMGPRR